MFVLPSRIAPARASAAATSLSASGTKSARIFGAGRGANAARPEIILERNRNAVERAPRAAALRISLRRAAAWRRARSARTVRNALRRRIPPLDSRERRVHQIDGRNLLPPQQPRGLLDGKKRQFGFGTRSHATRPRRFFPGAADFRRSRDSRCGIRRCTDFRCGSCRTKSGGIRSRCRSTSRCS